ncbi:MAG TPA: hypothetical protein VIV15_17480 [Anaerolineales bacterium]
MVDASGTPPKFAGHPKAKVWLDGNSVFLETRLELDSWEVDPDWDGQIFRSAAQAIRPVRSGEIPRELKVKGGRNICVRMVTVRGESYQLQV